MIEPLIYHQSHTVHKSNADYIAYVRRCNPATRHQSAYTISGCSSKITIRRSSGDTYWKDHRIASTLSKEPWFSNCNNGKLSWWNFLPKAIWHYWREERSTLVASNDAKNHHNALLSNAAYYWHNHLHVTIGAVHNHTLNSEGTWPVWFKDIY